MRGLLFLFVKLYIYNNSNNNNRRTFMLLFSSSLPRFFFICSYHCCWYCYRGASVGVVAPLKVINFGCFVYSWFHPLPILQFAPLNDNRVTNKSEQWPGGCDGTLENNVLRISSENRIRKTLIAWEWDRQRRDSGEAYKMCMSRKRRLLNFLRIPIKTRSRLIIEVY